MNKEAFQEITFLYEFVVEEGIVNVWHFFIVLVEHDRKNKTPLQYFCNKFNQIIHSQVHSM